MSERRVILTPECRTLDEKDVTTIDHLYFVSILFRVYRAYCLFANTIIHVNTFTTTYILRIDPVKTNKLTTRFYNRTIL
jgi:hypothetical protein